MICQLTKKNVASFMLVTFSCFFSFSQVAEKLYEKDFSKLSLVYNFGYMTGYLSQNNDGSSYPNLSFKDSYSNQFGFYYNFLQKNNFNFKTGIIAKEAYPLFDLNISNQDLGINSDGNYDLSDINPGNYFIFSVPIKAEYFLNFNKDINVVFGGGVNLNISTGGDEIETQVFVDNENESRDVFLSTTKQNQITFSTELSIGLNYNFKYALLQMDFFYSLNILPYSAEGVYEIRNLDNSSSKQGIYNINGDFYGVGLSITPKKGWLRSKKSKT